MRVKRKFAETGRQSSAVSGPSRQESPDPVAARQVSSSIPRRVVAWISAMSALLLASILLSSGFGAASVGFPDSLRILFGFGGGDQVDTQIVAYVRLPRILVGALVGAALATSGAVMQGIFRNPLADPGIIGVSTGGALGGVLAITTGLAAVSLLTLPALAFAGALAAGTAVYLIAAVSGRASTASLILAGIAISSLLGAVISLILLLTGDFTAIRQILFWLLGGLDARSWVHVRLLAVPVVIGCLICISLARPLNAMLLGDEAARGLGVATGRYRFGLLAITALMTGASVAVSGVISFVGLVVPHAIRLIAGPDHRILLPASALAGATFVVLADTLARSIAAPVEIRVGIVTAFAGAPAFLALLVASGRRTQVFTT